MPFDPQGAIESLQRSFGLIPAALLAIVFLAGPTLAWLLYRFVVQPRTSRYSERGVDLLWICARCRSANEARISRCYSCGMAQAAITGDLEVVDGDGVVALAPVEVAPGARGPSVAPLATNDPIAIAAATMATAPVATTRAAAAARAAARRAAAAPSATTPAAAAAKPRTKPASAAKPASTAKPTKPASAAKPASTAKPASAAKPTKPASAAKPARKPSKASGPNTPAVVAAAVPIDAVPSAPDGSTGRPLVAVGPGRPAGTPGEPIAVVAEPIPVGARPVAAKPRPRRATATAATATATMPPPVTGDGVEASPGEA